jgi:hypothetical protein
MPKHVHIHFAPRRTRDQATGSVPFALKPTLRRTRDAEQDVMPLVEALMQAIADRQGTSDTMTHDRLSKTRDTLAAFVRDAGEWQEHLHPRGEGGQFTSGQHTAAAANHQNAAEAHAASAKSLPMPMGSGHAEAAELHTKAAELHTQAAQHLTAQTGLGKQKAELAHKATFGAAKASGNVSKAEGDDPVAKVRALASDPTKPVAVRAKAAAHLEEYEKQADKLASSPHAIPKPDRAAIIKAAAEAHVDKKLPGLTTRSGQPILPNRISSPGGPGPGAKPTPKFDPRAEGPAEAPAAPGAGPVGEKPTQGPGGPAKAATHALLSSGHPFSVEELMKATGVTQRSTMMTALSDLKNPKYAGKLGALAIEKRPDGMYHVTKAPEGGFKAVGAANTSAAPAGGQQAATGSIAQPPAEGAAADPNAVVHGSHPLSDYMPGQVLKSKGAAGKEYKVLGHNAEGKVVVQGPTGTKHNMEPSALKAATQASAPAPAAPASVAQIQKPTAASRADLPEINHETGEPAKRGIVPAAAERLAKRGPIQQENRNLEAKQLKESRQMVKTSGPDTPSSARGEQAKADVAKYKTNAELANEDVSPKNYMDDLPPKKPATPAIASRGKAANRFGQPPKKDLGTPPPTISPEMKARLAKLAPKINAQQAEGKANEARAFSNKGPDMPGKAIPPKPSEAVRSGQATGAAAVKSGAGPSAPGKKTLESINHHQEMEKFHRSEADRIKGRPGAGSYKDHLRAATMHANAAADFQAGKHKGGWTPVNSSSANALSKSLGFEGPGKLVQK